MRKSRHQNLQDCGLLVVMAMGSLFLTVLQFRWTGEVAEAERTRVANSLNEQAEAFTTAFDRELTELCRMLRNAADANALGAAWAAEAARQRSGEARPLLRRISLARFEASDVVLGLPDSDTAALTRSAWPEEWSALRENLRRKKDGGSPPFFDPTGLLLEFPSFSRSAEVGLGAPRDPPSDRAGSDQSDGAKESHWLIVELDGDYLRKVWLPHLVERHLPGVSAGMDEVVVLFGSGHDFFSTTKSPTGAAPDLSLRFNHQGRDRDEDHSPTAPAWTLQIHRRPGALETAVAASRRRNLAVAVLLNSLLLAAGGVLVLQARRSRRLAEARMNFVANVTHELRTPLTVIRGAAHNIRRGIVQDPARVEHYAHLIDRHVDQLAKMVEQVLEYSRIGRMDGPSGGGAPLASAHLLREAITAGEPDAEAAHCVIETEIPDALPEIRGDEAALRRMFQNLLANAAKHGGSGGWIGVTAREAGSGAGRSLEVRIMDRGPGVPTAEREEIFEPFTRGRRARDLQVRGSGIGLSLARETARAHFGDITLADSNSGAIFIVRLPAAAVVSAVAAPGGSTNT